MSTQLALGVTGSAGSTAASHAAAKTYRRGCVQIYCGDFLSVCESWPSPTVIVADGPYGIKSFPGDPPTPESLAEWYAPYIECWSKRSTPQTTLWFWNTEIGWATVHPRLAEHGWEYRACHIWNKGVGHVAGNANSLTLRKFPIVTEVCVQYIKKARFQADGKLLDMKEWLRHEWFRTGLPLYKANEACRVRNAATRKYLTDDHLWYYPPPEAFHRLAEYANKHGRPSDRAYFSIDGKHPLSREEWAALRAKFNCEVGVTNVWSEPPVRGPERVKNRQKCIHLNQKPLRLIELIIRASSDPGDTVWEPFGGLCSVAVACFKLNRRCMSAEILPKFFEAARQRLASCTNGPA